VRRKRGGTVQCKYYVQRTGITGAMAHPMGTSCLASASLAWKKPRFVSVKYKSLA